MKSGLWMAGLMVLTGTQTAHADDAALRRCRGIVETQARLACYDALPLAPQAPAAAAAPAPVPAPVPAPAAPPTPAVAPKAPPASFGLEQPAAEPEAVTSSIPGPFEGWAPRQRLRLANGQVWQVVDDSSGVYDLRDPKVSIKRSLLGGFVMEIEGARRTLRVRRLE